MKLYELVEKIEAIGEVEKKTETLNESVDTSSAFWNDFWDGPSKTLNESLTEAANPDNAEVNAVLRKWADSNRNRISKCDQKILDDAGIKLKTHIYDAPHKYAVHKDNEGDIVDLHTMDKHDIKNTHPDYDHANDLATTGRHRSNRDRYNKNKDPNFPWGDAAYRKETPEESKALRPYSDKYKSLKRAVDDSEGYPYWHPAAERDLDDFKANMAAMKNESLDAYDMHDGSIRDEFYSLIDGMDPVDAVDMMVSHMNEYEMEDLIKSIRAEVYAIDDMEEELTEDKDLSTVKGSMTQILQDNKDKIDSCTTPQEVHDVVAGLLAEADLDTPATRRLLMTLKKQRNIVGALQAVYNSILKGSDLGTIK